MVYFLSMRLHLLTTWRINNPCVNEAILFLLSVEYINIMNHNFCHLILTLAFAAISGALEAQQLSSKDATIVKSIAHEINVEDDYTNGNWKSVLKEVKDKRLVLIGELNHGVRENFVVRNDLIKSLHEDAGFNVILLEAGIGEVFVIDKFRDKFSPEIMTYSLMSQWQTKEFSNLMTYAKSKNIALAGFDIQRGFGGFFENMLDKVCHRKNIDSLHYHVLEDRFLDIKKKLVGKKSTEDDVMTQASQLISSYEKLLELLYQADGSMQSTDDKFTIQTLKNRIGYLNYMLTFARDKDWNKRWAARDQGMADNVNWLLENVYPNEKIIIVAHNFHISKHNEKEAVMGEFLKQDFGDQMYSIGAFVGTGEYWEGGQAKKIAPPHTDKADVKDIINMLDGRVHFIHIPSETKKREEWMDRKTIVNDSFINLSRGNEIVLSKWFDGLLLIDTSSIPSKNE